MHVNENETWTRQMWRRLVAGLAQSVRDIEDPDPKGLQWLIAQCIRAYTKTIEEVRATRGETAASKRVKQPVDAFLDILVAAGGARACRVSGRTTSSVERSGHRLQRGRIAGCGAQVRSHHRLS